MAIDQLDTTRIGGTGISGSHVQEFLDKIEEMITGINASKKILTKQIITDDCTLTTADSALTVVCTTKDITITLFDADTYPDDGTIQEFWIKKSDDTGYNVIIQCVGSNTFSGGHDKIVIQDKATIAHIGVTYIGDGVQGWLSVVQQPVRCQVSRSASFPAASFPTTFTPVPFDQTLVEDNNSVLDHDNATNTERIVAKVKGIYNFSYWMSIDSTGGSTYTVEAQLRKNGTTLIPNSYARTGNFAAEDQSLSIGVTGITLDANDYVEIVVRHTSLTGNLPNVEFVGSITI